ncbi:MAG: hypothetical protein HY053_00480 [Proteobacteria bacterium]|nr:hypothetical protein [Pseudomonadota bacterium]
MISKPVIRLQAATCVALVLLSLLCACGRRPQTMEAPEGDDPKMYPRHYPDIRTDPAGTYVPPAPHK